LTLDSVKTIDEYAKRLASLTPGKFQPNLIGFSGAELANLCNEAAIQAARSNKSHVQSIDFELASERIMAGLEKKKLVNEKERRTVAYHEAGHAVVGWFLEGGSPLLKITIVPRTKGSLGFT
jgi:AFG3 family protein